MNSGPRSTVTAEFRRRPGCSFVAWPATRRRRCRRPDPEQQPDRRGRACRCETASGRDHARRGTHRPAVAGRGLAAAGAGLASTRASARSGCSSCFGPPAPCFASLFGGKVSLGIFEPAHFKDFLWRGMFAKSLPDADFELVTARHSASCAGRGRSCMPSASLRRSSGAGSTPGSTPRASTSWWSKRRSRRESLAANATGRAVSRRHSAADAAHDQGPGLPPAAHYQALLRNARDGAWFACVSEATRLDLLSVMPRLANRAVTIPNMVSHHFFPETCRRPRASPR